MAQVSYPQLTEAVRFPLLPNITQKRFNQFVGGHFAPWNLSSALDLDRKDDREHVQMWKWSPPSGKPSFDEAKAKLDDPSALEPFEPGMLLGKSWSNHWLLVKLKIPDEWRKLKIPVIFEFNPSCEALIFTTEGLPLHAITGGGNSSDGGIEGGEDSRIDHVIPTNAVDSNGIYTCIIEVSCNAMFGVPLNGFRHQQPDMNLPFYQRQAALVLPNPEAHGLLHDFNILKQIADAPHKTTSSLSQRALYAANEIQSTFRPGHNDTIAKCRAIAEEIFGEGWQKNIDELWKMPDDEATVVAVGHCHIDTAWLWSYSVTQQKIARSWSSQIDLMDRYPEHQFLASQAQQYYWLETLYPSLFEKLKEKVKSGQFQPTGACFIEMDTNLPSGESLCRQFLYGQRYFESRFGKKHDVFLLPDTFGYSSQLPQIARLGGTANFFTQKLSWNNINVFPFSSFNWIGIDGSQILTHMTPIDSYNAQANYLQVTKGATLNKNMQVTNSCVMLFGNGDGGGGPTVNMLERLRRLRAVGTSNREAPLVKMGSIDSFFEKLRSSTLNGSKLPTWRGELYFELHRGTYTSQADLKKGNKDMERLLKNLEFYATIASLVDDSFEYPKEKLDEIWRDVMLMQFHDVIPGTSIRMVIDDTLELYRKNLSLTSSLLDSTLSALFTASSTKNPVGQSYLNTLRIPRIDVVEVPRSHNGSNQSLVDKKEKEFTIVSSGAERQIAQSASVPGASSAEVLKDGSVVLKNGNIQITFKDGRISSLRDIALDRELMSPGTTGGLVIYEDFPNAYDAWDAEIYHLECGDSLKFDSVAVKDNGPIRSSVVALCAVGKSKVTITISLDSITATTKGDSRSLIRFDTEIDWHEKHRFLKFELPVDIHAPNATFGTQFGALERPTHRNTSWDAAKFEVCGHQFADLSEYGYGVALLCDNKYGYAVEGNVMRLSILRSATAPDPLQDEGYHRFSFGVLPHLGRFLESDVYVASNIFANPLIAVPQAQDTLLESKALEKITFTVEGPQASTIIAETVKRGEDDKFTKGSSKTVIVRMFESLGGKSKGTFKITGLKVKGAEWTNILEEKMSDAVWKTSGTDTVVELNLRGFEIKTLKLTL